MDKHRNDWLTTGLAALHFSTPAASAWDPATHAASLQGQIGQTRLPLVSSLITVPSVLNDVIDEQK